MKTIDRLAELLSCRQGHGHHCEGCRREAEYLINKAGLIFKDEAPDWCEADCEWKTGIKIVLKEGAKDDTRG